MCNIKRYLVPTAFEISFNKMHLMNRVLKHRLFSQSGIEVNCAIKYYVLKIY